MPISKRNPKATRLELWGRGLCHCEEIGWIYMVWYGEEIVAYYCQHYTPSEERTGDPIFFYHYKRIKPLKIGKHPECRHHRERIYKKNNSCLECRELYQRDNNARAKLERLRKKNAPEMHGIET